MSTRRQASSHTQLIKAEELQASNRQSSGYFGESVAVDGGLIAVGAALQDSGGTDSGAAFLFETTAPNVWAQLTELKPQNIQTGDHLGQAIAVSADTVVIGAPNDDTVASNAGAIYVFERDSSGTWLETAKLTVADAAADDGLGNSVALDTDLLVAGAIFEDAGATNAGAAYVFERDGTGTWGAPVRLTGDAAADAEFGTSLDVDAGVVVVGAPYEDNGANEAGAAYVFESDGAGGWPRTQKLDEASPDFQAHMGKSVGVDGALVI